jgi:hypothetical protein
MDTLKKVASTSPFVNLGTNIHGIVKEVNNSSDFEDLSPSSSTPEAMTKIIFLEPANSDLPLLSASPASQVIQIIILALALFMASKCKVNGNVSVMQLLLAALCSPCYILYRIIKPCKI